MAQLPLSPAPQRPDAKTPGKPEAELIPKPLLRAMIGIALLSLALTTYAVLTDRRPSMAAEDFSFFAEQRPACYVWIGNGPSEGGRSLHSSTYDFNDAILGIGASYWVRLVEEALPKR